MAIALSQDQGAIGKISIARRCQVALADGNDKTLSTRVGIDNSYGEPGDPSCLQDLSALQIATGLF